MNKVAKLTWLALAALIAIVIISLLIAKRNADNPARTPKSDERG